jgi:hypothetical protein
MIGACRPGVAADLARAGEGVPTPQDVAGFGIESRQPASYAEFPSGVAAVDDPLIIKRRARYAVPVVPILDRRFPHLLAGLDVESNEIGVELAEEQHSFTHSQAAVEPATAYRRDLLVDSRPALPKHFPRLCVEREHVVIAGDHVHDPVLDERRRLARVFPAGPGALEAGHPGSLELLDVVGVNLLQRRIALVGQVSPVRHPVLADRTLQQLVDLGIGRPRRACSRDCHAKSCR